MNTTLIIAKPDTVTGKAQERLLELITTHEFRIDWDGEPADEENFDQSNPLKLYSREADESACEEIFNAAREHGVLLAIHTEFTGSEACNFNLVGNLSWYDPETGKSGEAEAGGNDPEPLLNFRQIQEILTNPAKQAGFLADARVLSRLGLLDLP